MRIGLLVIGDEILSGRRNDQHLSAWIRLLSERGLSLSWAQYLGDEPARITDALRHAFATGDLVVSCGGIGATPDDHTRACAAQALERPLALHPQARELILARMRHMAAQQPDAPPVDPQAPDTLSRLEMGVFPVGAEIVPNPYNQIPGFRVGHVHFLPGFPVMAHPMMAWILDSLYPHLHGQQRWRDGHVIVQGAMEATLTPLMQDLEARYPAIKVFSLPSVDHPQWGRHIELGVKTQQPMPAQGPDPLDLAYADLLAGLRALGAACLAEHPPAKATTPPPAH